MANCLLFYSFAHFFWFSVSEIVSMGICIFRHMRHLCEFQLVKMFLIINQFVDYLIFTLATSFFLFFFSSFFWRQVCSLLIVHDLVKLSS